MGQQVNVVALRAQLQAKLSILESGQKTYKELRDKHNTEREQAYEKHRIDDNKWHETVTKIIRKSGSRRKGTLSVHDGKAYVTLEIDATSLPPRPHIEDYPYSPHPDYFEYHHTHFYNHLDRRISVDAVICHLKKALEMIDVLPQGTTEITIKNFDFLTKY
jgi:hypothetical protein